MGGKADYSLSEYMVHGATTSLGATPVASYIPVPYDGTIIESFVAVGGTTALTGVSTTTLAVLPAGVVADAVNVGTTLVLASGAAVGRNAMAVHTGARSVRAGDTIRLTPAGATGASVVGNYSVKIKR